MCFLPPTKTQHPGLVAIPLWHAPRVPLWCAEAAPPCANPLSLSPFQLSRHNKSLQQLLKPVKRIQEEEEEGISSMVRKALGNRGRAPRPRAKAVKSCFSQPH